ncbi:MAG: zinc-dependent peptidase [Xanthomonadaceae bacterium]|nr:zinc-dependent peptidase [Xanthomonadaceae bacterium]
MASVPAGDVPLIGNWLGRWRRKPPEVVPALWAQAWNLLPWSRTLEDERVERLRGLTGVFLHRKTITPVAGLELDETQRVMLAALCCMPLIGFGENGLRGWDQLIVYPDAFRVKRDHMDAAGVLHEYEDDLIGESWEAGPLILSWADVCSDLQDPEPGFCVAAHEMAHKLDALDGVLDGAPPLPRDWRKAWASDFQRTYDRFCEQVERGVETVIDPYAAEAPEEFFAVVSEYHFSGADILRKEMLEVAAHLTRFYGDFRLA